MGLQERCERAGLSPGEAAAQCLDFDLACMFFGRWTDERREATKPVPVSAKEKRRQTKQVPKYRTLREVLGFDLEDSPATRSEPETPPEIVDTVNALRRDPAALADYLRAIGEG